MTGPGRVRAIVRGEVQGVGFRYSAREEAERLGLTGFVRNRPDGTVEAEAEGPDTALQAFVDWLGNGPEFASVHGVDLERLSATGGSGFELRH